MYSYSGLKQTLTVRGLCEKSETALELFSGKISLQLQKHYRHLNLKLFN